MSLRFSQPAYKGDRQVLMSGQIEIGAVFGPCNNGRKNRPWSWRIWLTPHAREGHAKSEIEAKNAALAATLDFLRAAELQPTPKEQR